MNRTIIAAVAATAMFATPIFAQSAKFAAVYDESPRVVQSKACASTMSTYCRQGVGDNDRDVARSIATIKVPQSKELLVGVSAQVALFTETLVKGKRGSYSRALAEAEGNVSLMACNADACYRSHPGKVVLSKRTQELSAVLAGIIEECTFDVTLDVVEDEATGEATWDLSDCVVADEEINLALHTWAAHHYNFLFPNLPQGEYDVIARFVTKALAEAEAYCPDDSPYCISDDVNEETGDVIVGDGEAGAKATAIIGKTMMTIQEVRAVNSDFNEPIEIPQ